MITFSYPWCFILVLAPMLIRWVLPVHHESRAAVRVPFLTRLAALTHQTPTPGSVVLRRSRPQSFYLVIAWLCTILALARPQWVEAPITKTLPTRDILLAVDLSGSMGTEDFTDDQGQQVDRLTAVKQVLDAFLTKRKGDRVGLIVFGSAAFVQAPFTEDLNVCRSLLQETQVRMAGPQTKLGDAVGLAITVFERSDVKERVLIVLTDGNDTGSQVPPDKAAAIARDKGIKIYTVAVGDPQAAGEEKLDEEMLKTMASTTDGAYFNAANREALARIYQRLDELETHEVETTSYRPKRDLYHWPLAVLVVMSLLYYSVVVVRQWLRDFNRQRASAGVSVGVLLILSFFLLSASSGSPTVAPFHFLRPWWLIAMVPACGLAALIWRHQDAQRPWQHLIDAHLLTHLLVGGQQHRRVRPVQVLLVVWLTAIIALAGPTWRRELAPFTADQAALAIAIEVTPTMQAQDIQPSRLQRTAQKVHDLLALRPGAKTALVAYAGSAHLVMPMTQDARIIEMFADQLSPDMMPRTGDVAAAALVMADEQIRSARQPGSIVWMTDGVEADQWDGLKRYRERGGVAVHLLAVAGDAGVPLPPDSPPAPALDRDALKRVAKAVGGTLTVVSPDDRDVAQLVRHIETRFVAAQDTEGSARWQDMGYWLTPLLCVLILLWFRPGWVVQEAS
jgi:Ca-activated chloride channel homolog